MASPLDAIRLKTARADKHFEEFKALLGLGPNATATAKVSGIHLKNDWTLHFTTSDASKPSPDVGIVFGDSVHQLRSALDHLVCALAMRTRPSDVCEKFKLQFPIFKDQVGFCAYHLIQNGTLRCLVGAREFKSIEEAQPYQRDPINPEIDPLYVLSKLDNVDKHRLVIELEHTISAAGTIYPQTGPPVEFRITKQRMLAETQPVDIGKPYPPGPFTVSMDKFMPLVVLPEVELSVFTFFRRMQDIVNRTIDSFEPFFT